MNFGQFPFVISIDGPTASGKGAVAQQVAEKLGFHYLDSGALYRLIALKALEQDWTLERILTKQDVLQLETWALGLNAEFDHDRVLLDGYDVSLKLRLETTGNMASKIATVPALRNALLERQRQFAQPPGLIADGRDMGSVVFPNANLKIFLTATAQVRAERRYKQLINKGFSAKMDVLLADLIARDERDMHREIAPLKPSEDMWVVDSSDMTLDQTVKLILAKYAEIEGTVKS